MIHLAYFSYVYVCCYVMQINYCYYYSTLWTSILSALWVSILSPLCLNTQPFFGHNYLSLLKLLAHMPMLIE